MFARLESIPANYTPWIPLLPINTVPDAFGFDWYQDSGNFIMNPFATRALAAGAEIFLPNMPYSEIKNFNITAGYTYQWKDNPDGTTNHLFTFDNALANGNRPFNLSADDPSGTFTGGNNPDFVESFSS